MQIINSNKKKKNRRASKHAQHACLESSIYIYKYKYMKCLTNWLKADTYWTKDKNGLKSDKLYFIYCV